jgi:hypothetical protein
MLENRLTSLPRHYLLFHLLNGRRCLGESPDRLTGLRQRVRLRSADVCYAGRATAFVALPVLLATRRLSFLAERESFA